jgi:uncharacterized protein
MDTNQDVKEQLLASNEEFSRLAKEHADYEHQLELLSSRSHLSEEEQIQEITLKKRKLSLKDQMESIIQRYRREVVHS